VNNSKFILTTCCVAVSSTLLSMTGMARADDGNTSQATDAKLQQVIQLQKETQEKVNQLQKDMQDMRVTDKKNNSAWSDSTSHPYSPNGDWAKLSETPDGYRVIDTGTTSVGLYGLIDVTFSHESTGGPNGGIGAVAAAPTTGAPATGLNNKPWTGMDVSWMNGNRWGITGSHLLDEQSKTNLIFRLESEFELPTGNFDGGYASPILFNRDAWIGFSSEAIGKLTFGRQDSLGRDVNMIWANPFSTDKNGYGEGGWMNNQVMYQMMEYSGSPTGNRWDDTVVWKKKWGNVLTYAGHQFGGLQNNVNTGNYGLQYTDNVYSGLGLKGTQDALGLGYNSSDDMWHASSSYTHANYDGYAKEVESIGGNIRPVPWLRLNGGVYHANIAQPIAIGNRTDNTYTVSAQIYPGGKLDYALAYYHIDAKNAGINPAQGYNGFTGGTAQPFDLTNGFTQAASGTWGTVYGAVFYRWDKQTDFYLAADYSKVGGGYISPYFQGNSKTTQVGGGMRFFF